MDVKSKEYKETKREMDEIKEWIRGCCLYFFYGGAIRGGKTYISLALFVIFSKMFPKSKWVVVRATFPRLKETAIPSLEKILGNTQGIYWKRQSSEYFCQFENGSRIYFVAENYDQDKNLSKFLGLEVNGFLLEQMEELSEKGFNTILSRAGSHYGVVGAMPPPIVMGTFNPSYSWVNKKIHDPGLKGQLEPPYYFIQGLPQDNKFVTEEQWRVWSTLDEDTYNRMILGKLNTEVKKAYLWSFNEGKHTRKGLSINYAMPIWISFDFNVDPMTAIIFQTDHRTFFRIIHAFKVANSDTYDLCENYIKPLIKGREHMVYVTGDASGKNRISGSKGHLNHYQIIKSELRLKDDQFELLAVNPGISENRVFMNSVLQHFPEFVLDESLEELIKDMKFTLTEMDRNGNLAIKKTGMNEYLSVDNKELGHLMDCVRYGATVTLHDFVTVPKS